MAELALQPVMAHPSPKAIPLANLSESHHTGRKGTDREEEQPQNVSAAGSVHDYASKESDLAHYFMGNLTHG
jgi:hypothetical protein